MPDNTVVTVQCRAHPGAEKYLVGENRWVSAGRTPIDLVEAASVEIGAGVALPDGRALFIGATPHTSLYTPGTNPEDTGSWALGPDIPPSPDGRSCGAKDAPACLMTNGNVLLTVGPVDGLSNHYLGPTYFYEFDGADLVRVQDPPNAGQVPYVGRMLLLPSGEILYSSGTRSIYVYPPSASFDPKWRPEVVNAPRQLLPGFSYTLTGRQLTGLSQAVGYGDDAAGATNYPMVLLRSGTGEIYYCRTFGHSTMAISTGSAVQSTNFAVPTSVPQGSYELIVVANGIPSVSYNVSMNNTQSWVRWDSIWDAISEAFVKTPPTAIGSYGPIRDASKDAQRKKEIVAARNSIVDGIKSLKKIGKQIEKQHLATARKKPRAVDPEFAAFLGRSKSSHSKPEDGG